MQLVLEKGECDVQIDGCPLQTRGGKKKLSADALQYS